MLMLILIEEAGTDVYTEPSIMSIMRIQILMSPFQSSLSMAIMMIHRGYISENKHRLFNC